MLESSISNLAGIQWFPWLDYADLDGAILSGTKEGIGRGAALLTDRSQCGGRLEYNFDITGLTKNKRKKIAVLLWQLVF